MLTRLEENARRAHRRLGAVVVDGAFNGIASAGRFHPRLNALKRGVEVFRDVPYRVGGAVPHRLDVYRPPAEARNGRCALYIHGGGFRILSKETHFAMALRLAMSGYVVFLINYRLAPQHPFPAALDDVSVAYRWVVDNASRYGADASKLVVAGESAGANLTLGVTVAACWDRPESYAQRVFSTGVVPVATMPACGLLQVSDPWRFGRRRALSAITRDRIEEVWEAYLATSSTVERDFADPLVIVEQASAPSRALPPMFAPVGTADPLLDDTRRLAVAVRRHGGVCDDRYYPGEIHAFHAFLWRDAAQRCWRDTFEFLDTAFAVG